jgi:serine/threonine protein kinase
MADSAGDPVVGATLAGYLTERRLGRGGMSVAYLAEDLALGRKVALKILGARALRRSAVPRALPAQVEARRVNRHNSVSNAKWEA